MQTPSVMEHPDIMSMVAGFLYPEDMRALVVTNKAINQSISQQNEHLHGRVRRHVQPHGIFWQHGPAGKTVMTEADEHLWEDGRLDGSVTRVVHYVEGQKHGIEQHKNAAGRVIMRVLFEHGKKHGFEMGHHDSGGYIKPWKHGKQDGISYRWDDRGNFIVMRWVNGTIHELYTHT